jgi:uncharacterized protein (TIGR03083 family)
MLWTDLRTEFFDAAGSVRDLVAGIEAWDRPGLGSWTVAELAGHTLRAVETPTRYLTLPAPPDPTAIGGPAGYYRAYLDWRAADPEAADAAVAARGVAAGTEPERLPERYDDAIAAARRALDATDAGRLVETPFGAVAIRDYLPTRTVELVVHGLDLGHALGVSWAPPSAALARALEVMAAVAADGASGPDVLLALTGRGWVDPTVVLPILR